MKSIRSLSILALLATAHGIAASPLFDSDDVLEIELEGHLSTLIDDVDTRARHAVTLSVEGRAYRIEASVRGKSRTRVCQFPPLRLYFDQGQMAESGFAGQDRLKLVTHCRNHEAAEINLLEEYAAYRVLNAVTDASYRARLVRVRYVDTEDRLDQGARYRYGMLLESRRELAARLGGTAIDIEGVRRSELDDEQAALMYVFQYVIGNTDWSLVRNDDDDECCHNVDLVAVNGEIVPIPYDFDLAGVVDAPYAKPDPSLRTKNVRQRRYRGYCLPTAPLRRAVERFVERRDAVESAVRATPAEDRDVRRIVRYLDDFYRAAGRPDRLLAGFERRCL